MINGLWRYRRGDEEYIFTGFMGTGKTTISKLVAEKLGMQWIDLDDMITKKENRSIVDIFNEEGEEYFRELEKKSCLI